MSEIEDLVTEAEGIAREHDYKNLLVATLIWSYRIKAMNSEFDEADKLLTELTKISTSPDNIFHSHLLYIDFYYNRYRETNNRDFLNQSKVWLEKLENNTDVITQREWWYQIFKSRQAKILSHGSFRDKATAIDLVEELLEKSPDNNEFLTIYIEILIQEMLVSDQLEKLQKIEDTIERMDNLILQNKPEAIVLYTQNRRIHAQYLFYIKEQYDQAFELLLELERTLEDYNLPYLLNLVKADKNQYENELSKESDTSTDIRQRILRSKIMDYIHKASKEVNVDYIGEFS